MKKRTNLARAATTLLLAMLTTVGAWADDTMKYASGSTWTDNRPINAQYKYSLSQQIYTPAQLGDVPFGIKTLGFYNSVSNAVTRQLEIYMVETEKSSFEAGTDWVAVTSADLVFSGEVTFVSNGWNTITLTKTFTYTATKNVALVVNDNTGEQVASNYPKCRVNTGLASPQSKFAMNNDAAYDATALTAVSGNDRYYSLNQLQIGIDSPTKPSMPAISKSSSTKATATWTGDGDSWNLQYKLKSASAWTTVSNLNEQSYILSGLEPSQDYQVRAQAVSGGKPSLWSSTREFNASTLNKPTALACTAFTANTVTLGWTEQGTATEWQICFDGDATNLINITTNSYVFANLTPGEKHTAKVRSVSGSDFSAWSDVTAVESTSNTVIGSGTVFEDETIPIHHANKCSVTEEIYTTTELGSDPKMIKSIGFYVPEAYDNGTRQIDIYMVPTTKTYFQNSNDWLPLTTADRVFSGSVNFKPTGWINITLSEPFEYDCYNNVAIIVDDNTASLNSLYFSVYNSTSNVTLHKTEDTNRDPTNINVAGTRYGYKNVICLGMEDPVCRRPVNLNATTIGPNSAVLDWTEVGDATEWQLCVGDDETNLIAVNAVPYTLAGLTAETAYTVKVRAVKGSEHGNWCTAYTFTTTEVNPVPFDVAVSAKHTSATIRWTGFSDSYNVRYKATVGNDDWTTVTANQCTVTITGLTADTDYTCQVQGVVGGATSEWSSEYSGDFTTPAEDVKLFVTDGNWNDDDNWMPAGVPTATDDVVIMAAAVIPSGIVAVANKITIDGDNYGGGGGMARTKTAAKKRAPAVSTPSITIKDGGQLRHATDNLLVTVEKKVAGYGTNTTGGYRMLGVPFDDFLWPGGENGMTNGNHDIYGFSSDEALEWRNYKAEAFTMFSNNASGYLYANSTNQILAFTGRTDANNSDGFYSGIYVDNTKPVTPFTNGWRVFANNYVSNLHIAFGTYDSEDNFTRETANFYKMNATGNGFDLYKNYVIVAPGEAIFVEVGKSGTLHCSFGPLYRYEPTAAVGTFYLPFLPEHGLTAHQDASPFMIDEASDNSSVWELRDGLVCNVTLLRTLNAGSYNSFAVPFDISAATLSAKGITAKELTGSSIDDGGNLSLTFAGATSIEAGKPYWVKVASTMENPTFENVTVRKTVTPTTTTSVDLVPTFGRTLVTGPAGYEDEELRVLLLGAGNGLFHPTVAGDSDEADSYMYGFRAYMQLHDMPAAVRSVSLDFGDGKTTGIIDINNDGNDYSGQYQGVHTLDGRKVNGQLRKGVYIENGKLVIKK